jgi:hypothetical protein
MTKLAVLASLGLVALAHSPTHAQSPSLSSPSAQPAPEREAGPPDAVIRKLGAMTASQTYKRGHTLVSQGGISPKGTLVYPVQIINGDASVAAVAYFFRDEFDNWAVSDKKGNVFH